MYNVSDAYLKQIKRKVQTFCLTGTVNKIAFTNHDILSGSFTITNQCSEQNDVKIGSVYIGELRCTFKPELPVPDWTNAEIVVSEGLLIGDKWEDVPLGIYTVSEANDTEYGIDITAYDNMARFNRSCSVDITIGTPYELLTLACTTCEVELSMPQEEVDALPNGTESLSLYTENDIETWQDFIFWVAQATGTFATMDRQGKLMLRQYGQTVVDTLTNHDRFTGSKFSKFETRYSGLSCVNMADDTTSYYGSDPDNYLTYNLGSNPFMQYGVDSYKEKIRRAVLGALLQIDYVPFETSCLCGAMYDLGDILRCTDGIAQGKLGCVMMYDYTFNGGYKITGFGSDPALATAKSKTDKNLEGLRNNVSTNEILFFNYENASAIQIGDCESKAIIDIRFTSSVSIGVLFQAEILLEATATEEDVIGTIEYMLNEVTIIGYNPTETWKNGKHILSLIYMLMIEENSINRWIVKLNIAGGSIAIAQGAVRAVIYGQGLVGTVEWDGFITLEDSLYAAKIQSVIDTTSCINNVTVNMIDFDKNNVLDILGTSDIISDVTSESMMDNVTFRFNIESWTFNTSSQATYSKRYIDISEDSYRLNTNYIYISENIPIDIGKACKVCIDFSEFKDVLSLELEDDTSVADIRYLIQSQSVYYTINDSELVAVDIESLNSKEFIEYGTESVVPELIMQLESPVIYKYTSEDVIKQITISMSAIPFQQIIQTECDMLDESIYGVSSVDATYTGDIYTKLSYDNGKTYTDELLLKDAAENEMLNVYNKLDDNKCLLINFILKDTTASLSEFKYYFTNQEV